MDIESLKQRVRGIGAKYPDREQRARRLYIEERAASFSSDREIEFQIKTEISNYFSVPYNCVSFCGSAQLGFSIHKDTVFTPGKSDLDVACISVNLYQYAWRDIVNTTRAFSDLSSFRTRDTSKIELFKAQIANRGMINIDMMPLSNLHREWVSFQDHMGRKYSDLFKRVSVAIYINEYAFCLKQDTSLSQLMR